MNLKEKIALNRRNFIKLVVGGAVGINLTPLPWKLTDDIAIWTQNWPWVPVPPVGEFSHLNSICMLCPGGCGIQVRKAGHRAVKIEGRTDYPINPGGICPLGAGGLQLLYNESNRFTGPVKRVGPRGAGKFEKITWDEALQELAQRLTALRNQGKPEAIAAIDGNLAGSSISLLIERLLLAFGSPNYTRIPRSEDTFRMANRLMLGHEGPMAYDLENADFILSFGCGLIDGWGSPGRVMNAWGTWHTADPKRRRTKIVQIDARASNTASKSDQWLPVRPGTEVALALGLAHVIIQKGLYDRFFVENHAFGFDDWTSDEGVARKGFKTMVLEKYSPKDVSDITGLKADAIVALAEDFAGAKAPLALFGKGKGDLDGSLYECMAIQALNALVGSLNRSGGVLARDPLPLNTWPEVSADHIARAGLQKARLDQAGSSEYPFSESLIYNMAEAIVSDAGSSVDTLLIFSANPAYTLPDGGLFRRALEKVPYVVSFSPYQDETAFMADLILPDHVYLEKTEDVVWPSGLQYPFYGLSQPVVEPLYDTRPCGDVVIELAKTMGEAIAPAFPWKTFQEAIKERAKGLYEAEPGLTQYDNTAPAWKDMDGRKIRKSDYPSFEALWKRLEGGGFWYRPIGDSSPTNFSFNTPTTKFEFFGTAIERAADDAARGGSLKAALDSMGISSPGDEAFMPHYEGAYSASDDDKEYPLLMMPYEMINLSSGWVPNPHFLNKTLFDHQVRKNDSFAEINPQTAAEFKLKQGDHIVIESAKGSIKVRVNLFEGAMPGVVFLPLGLGHRAYDEYQRGKGANPNEIIDTGRDPISGHMVWCKTRVRIAKA